MHGMTIMRMKLHCRNGITGMELQEWNYGIISYSFYYNSSAEMVYHYKSVSMFEPKREGGREGNNLILV